MGAVVTILNRVYKDVCFDLDQFNIRYEKATKQWAKFGPDDQRVKEAAENQVEKWDQLRIFVVARPFTIDNKQITELSGFASLGAGQGRKEYGGIYGNGERGCPNVLILETCTASDPKPNLGRPDAPAPVSNLMEWNSCRGETLTAGQYDRVKTQLGVRHNMDPAKDFTPTK